MSDKRAVTGILLLAGGFPASLFMFSFTPLGYMLVDWYMSGRLNDLTLSIIRNVPISVLHIAGLSLYLAGRKEFLKRLKRDRSASLAFAILGVLLIVLGIFFISLNYAILKYYSTKILGHPLTQEKLAGYLLPFVWSVLWGISGLLWLADGSRKLMNM